MAAKSIVGVGTTAHYKSAVNSKKSSYLPRDVTEDQEALEPLFYVCIAQRCIEGANFRLEVWVF